MAKRIAILMALSMLGCNAGEQKSASNDGSRSSSAFQCPRLPGNLAITISGEQGVDFLSCLAKSDRTGKALFDVYIGNFPDVPEGLRYAGTTSTAHGNLVWFRPPSSNKPWDAKQWITFIPTGDETMSIMMVSFYAKPEDLKGIADIVVQVEMQ
jgi:hypothetical protein